MLYRRQLAFARYFWYNLWIKLHLYEVF